MMFGQTPVDRFKYKEKRKKALIGPGAHQFIQNLKHKPNMVQDLSR